MDAKPKHRLEVLDIALDRDGFLRDLLRELTGTLGDVVGEKRTRGFVSLVGQRMGEHVNEQYRAALQSELLDSATVAQVFVDLKRRLHGEFEVVSESARQVTLRNSACPFGDRVLDRTSLCMMTSNVFGTIAAENLGYARVEIVKSIAARDGHCHVVVHLEPSDDEVDAADDRSREYFRA